MNTIIIQALAGLGLFLYGMHIMEHALKNAAGSQFRKLLMGFTGSTPKAFITGVVSTAMLQSSSVIALMTLSFIGAGLITLKSAIGIIFGANIGTTATAWIVVFLGFKVSIGSFALTIMGLSALGMLLTASKFERLSAFMQIFVGFGLLFFGLDMLKSAIEGYTNAVSLQAFAHLALPLYALVGVLLTAIIQSSSAVTAITLSALFAQAISFEQAAMVAIGSNVGTTVTVLLGAFGDVVDKKRLAIVQVGFNIITALIALVLFYPLIWLVEFFVNSKSSPMIALALFHTFFNAMGVLVHMPFIHSINKRVSVLFVRKPLVTTKYIQSIDTALTDVALEGAQKELRRFFKKTLAFMLTVKNIAPIEVLSSKTEVQAILEKNQEPIEFDYQKVYEKNKSIQLELVAFLNTMTLHSIGDKQASRIDALLGSAEQLAYASKASKDIYRNIEQMAQSSSADIQAIYTRMRTQEILLFRQLMQILNANESHESVESLRQQAKSEHDATVKRIMQGFKEGHIQKADIAILLNVNQFVRMAIFSLCDAIEPFVIPTLKQKELP